MKKTLKYLSFAAIAVFGIVSCDLGDEEAPNFGGGPVVVQFPAAELTGLFSTDDNADFVYNVPVQTVGGNGLALGSDIGVTYKIVDSLTTAVAGLDYDFIQSGLATTIPAGATSGYIGLNVHSGELDAATPEVLTLEITQVNGNGANVVQSGNKYIVSVILQATCTSDLAGNYSVVSQRVAGGTGQWANPAEVITEQTSGIYKTTTTGYFGIASIPAGPTSYGFVFQEICGRITVAEQNLLNYYTNLVFQTPAQKANSTVNEVTGVITIEFTVTFATGNSSFRSTYTPL